MSTLDIEAPLPRARADLMPVLLVLALAIIALPLVGSVSTWVTLTFAGLAMGMIIFIVASGMTLVFGLMDVLNFGHGLFIAIGAYMAATVLGAMADWTQSGSLWTNLVAVLPAMIVGMLVAGAVVGASLFVFAQSYLQDGLHAVHEVVAGIPPLALLFEPDRWLLWLGILFVLSVYYFPTGVAGRLREFARRT